MRSNKTSFRGGNTVQWTFINDTSRFSVLEKNFRIGTIVMTLTN